MTRDKRLLLLLLMVSGLFVVECRYHQREDEATTTTTEARHRHRHRHESSNRRNHHELDRQAWQEVDYEYDADSEDPMDEDDYEAQSYYDHRRSHHRSAQRSYHDRMFEPRYPARYHGYYAASGWHDDNNDRRRISSRYNTKSHRHRPGKSYHRPVYSRNRDVSDFDDYTEEDYDYERPRTYVENDEADKRYERWRNSRRHASSKKDWRSRVNGYRNARRYRLEDREDVDRGDALRSTDDWRRRSNTSESRYRFSKDDRKTEEDEDYEDHGGLEEDDKDEEDDDIWKLIDDNKDNEEEVLDDDDSYKNKTKPPLKTYDDIIKRLTSDDPTTPKTTKRDYRNIEANRHAKRDSVKFKYDSRNVSKPEDFFTSAPRAAATTSNYFVKKRIAENSTVKSAGSAERKPPKNAIGLTVRDNDRQEGKSAVKMVDTQAKNKNLEQDLYDEYLNTPDNEKEDDVIKTDEDSGMQADVTNTDYTDDDNGDEDEATTDIFTTPTTTTTTTTTKPKPLINQYDDYKDLKAYDSNIEYNRYQARNEQPTMSPYSDYKWKSLGTRESVKETRNHHMQQYDKNDKGDEIKEALQHAIRVNKEGSCQWPRARVVPVRDVYPIPATTYIPHCVILHRCSDDTGCCRLDAFTCMPKHSHRVELSFYAIAVGKSIVKKLSFYNHTECECRERSKYDTMNGRSATQAVYSRQSTSPPQNMKKSPPRKTCRCPLQFMSRVTLEGICQCNCNENNQNCIKTRRGKGYLSLADRMCIQNNECASPNCEFGEYMLTQGKCPRKKDTIDASDHRTHPNHRYRMRRAAVDSG